MHTVTRVALALGVTLTGATLLGQTVGTASPTGSTPNGSVERVETTMLLNMPWTGGHGRWLDRGRKGVSVGDVFLMTGQPVNDERTGRRIGAADADELIMSGRHDGTVTSQSTLRLPGGHVELDGITRHTDHPIRVAVVGGTHKYAGAGGQMVLVREDPARKVDVVRLELILP